MDNNNGLGQPKITPDKAYAWLESRVGKKTAREISDAMGLGQRTVERYIHDFEKFIRSSEEFTDAADRIKNMLPLACDVYERHIKDKGSYLEKGNPDIMVATKVLESTGIIGARSKSDTNVEIKVTIEQLQRQREDNIKDGLKKFGYTGSNNRMEDINMEKQDYEQVDEDS